MHVHMWYLSSSDPCMFGSMAAGEPSGLGVGSVLVWAPTEKLGDEDSEFLLS
jgi:hypothetical protein